MKRNKEIKLYVSPEEIAELHERYAPLFKQFNIDQDCGTFYIDEMVETAMTTLRREIEELSEANRLEIEIKNARINAANEEQIPRFFRPLSRFFRRTPNRAMAAILDEAAIHAEDSLSEIEHKNNINNVSVAIKLASRKTSEELPKDEKGKPLSRRELNKLLKDPEKFLALFAPEEEQSDVEVNGLGEESEQQNVANSQGEEQQTVATLPIRKKRRAAERAGQLPGQIEINEINAENGE